MGMFNTYFAAADDAQAAAVVDDGPRGSFQSVVEGVGPVVEAGTLLALLLDRDYDAITGDPAWARLVSQPDHEFAWVVSMPAVFTSTLADATPERLAEVAAPWSQTDEFEGETGPDDLLPVLLGWRDLAATATENGTALYCWMAL